ncbi:hypothetical protein C2G38_2156278 [Gigaspora rosea]|uniref:HAT C-terminal dimerisation domain-containing protein n=1 Tax=Gigaspora rosea TaxID=44941 RepID=A0A397W4P5_9GLOM|nr:hypothetical protein C2G38_2156278 [Gigaspora rosea]
MARNYVPSEHVFSIAAHTITIIRSNLAPDSAQAVMCLKSWITKVRDDYYDYDKLQIPFNRLENVQGMNI